MKKTNRGVSGIEIALIIASIAIIGLFVAKPLSRKPYYPYVGILACKDKPIPTPSWKSLSPALKRSDIVSGLMIPPVGSKFATFATFEKKKYIPIDGDISEATWANYIVPPYSQMGPSCCGYAWANWMMMMVKRYVKSPDFDPIDGYAIWKRGREMFWKGNMEGGLYLSQGFLAAQDLGIIPAEAQLVRVENDTIEISQALLISPLVCGNYLNSGWYNPSPENGCLDHGADYERYDAHATTLIGVLVQSNTVFYLSANSWGGWGWNGLFVQVSECHRATTLDGPYAVEMPKGWEKTWKKRKAQSKGDFNGNN